MRIKALQMLQVPSPILGLKVWHAQSPRQAIKGGRIQQLITKLLECMEQLDTEIRGERKVRVVLTPGETQGTIKET